MGWCRTMADAIVSVSGSEQKTRTKQKLDRFAYHAKTKS